MLGNAQHRCKHVRMTLYLVVLLSSLRDEEEKAIKATPIQLEIRMRVCVLYLRVAVFFTAKKSEEKKYSYIK